MIHGEHQQIWRQEDPRPPGSERRVASDRRRQRRRGIQGGTNTPNRPAYQQVARGEQQVAGGRFPFSATELGGASAGNAM